jgi:hypothetical protein
VRLSKARLREEEKMRWEELVYDRYFGLLAAF